MKEWRGSWLRGGGRWRRKVEGGWTDLIDVRESAGEVRESGLASLGSVGRVRGCVWAAQTCRTKCVGCERERGNEGGYRVDVGGG